MKLIRLAIAIPLAFIALMLSLGPVFLAYGWLVGLDVHVRGGLLVLVADIAVAVLTWRAVASLSRPGNQGPLRSA